MSLLENLYRRLPASLQDLAVTAQGAVYYRQRFTGAFREEYELLRTAERSSPLQLELLQVARLRRMLAFANQHVPFYKSRIPSRIWDQLRAGDWSAFETLPITEKSSLRQNPEAFCSQPKPDASWIPWNTSGTTGTPIQLYYTRNAVARQYAFVERYRELAGANRFVRRAQFTGKMIAPGENPGRFWRYDYANHALLLSTVHLTSENIPRYLDALADFTPRYISGYPSAIALLAHHSLRAGRKDIHIAAALTSAETLLPEQRDVIEQAFGAKVFDQYGQTEMQSFWFECRYRRMHTHPLFGVTEILRANGTRCAPGETGDVVLTGLLNEAMPLIRYRVGDRARWSDEDRCPCGYAMPIIDAIEGRREDYLYSSQRGWVGRMDPALKGVLGVLECQFVQNSPATLDVYLVPTPGFTTLDRMMLEKNIHDRLGDRIQIETHFVPSIPRGANGKFRAVVSNLPRDFQPATGTPQEVHKS